MTGFSSSPPTLPPAFQQRMESLLGGEYPEFLAALQAPPAAGLRINTLKLNPPQFEKLSPFSLEPVPWCQAGFYLVQNASEGKLPGKHPYHAAGLYYLQEPSAMAVAELLGPMPGELVLDLAAAPGGKSTHLASLMHNQGLLIANEIHPKRVWDLAENLERWGAPNVIITNETPARLVAQLGAICDRVLVDAPCSGESLFRRNPAARQEWNTNLVKGCSLRQQAILEAAAGLVKPGGYLTYTTCTFNPDENEGSLAVFLGKHPDFQIVKSVSSPYFSPGRPDWLQAPGPSELTRAIRLWPHQANCEGHFIAILQRDGSSSQRSMARSTLHNPPKEAMQAFEEFCNQSGMSLARDLRLTLHGTYLYHSPTGIPDMGNLHLIHPGWWLGTWKKNRFEPSHALAIGIARGDVQRRIDLSLEEPASIDAYLRGESLRLESHDNLPAEDGWAMVTVDGFNLGWVKLVQGVAKNYYPRGLRWS